jgi:hypothetical protein
MEFIEVVVYKSLGVYRGVLKAYKYNITNFKSV